MDTSSDRIHLRVTGAFSGAEAIAAVPVQADGRIFRLGDIATVRRGYEDPPSFIVREGGRPALGLGVSMQDGANILTLGENLKQAMKAITAELPVGIDITQVADQPHIVDGSVSEFLTVFLEALAIVLLVSFLTLGLRTGVVVALSVPLVLAIVFIVMYATGMDLHRITLGALIIALGLLVDDAIIAIEMMVVKMEQGFDRARAATFAWTSTAFPMLTGTLVTAAGFLPVGFANSSTGEYAGGIFWVVGLALIASWFVAVLFTPYLGMKLLPDFAKRAAARRAHHDPEAIYDTRIYRTLRRVIEFCLRWRKSVDRRHRAHVRDIDCLLRPRAAAVLPDLDAHRAVRRDAAAGRQRDRRHRRGGAEGGAPAHRRSGHRDLYQLRRSGRAALLARAQSGAAERELRADRRRHQGSCRRANASRRGSKRRSPTARFPRRAPGSTASTSVRRSDIRCSSASSAPIR